MFVFFINLIQYIEQEKHAYGYTFPHTQKLVYMGNYKLQERDNI